MTQCSYKTDKGRQCKLDLKTDGSPHDGQHKTAIRNKTLPEGFSLQRVQVPSGDIQGAIRGSSINRDERQQLVDKDMKLAYDTWVKMGKPSPTDFFNAKQADHFTYLVPPDIVPTVLDMLRHSTGRGGTVEGKTLRYRKGVHSSGNTAIRYVAVDPTEKKKENVKK